MPSYSLNADDIAWLRASASFSAPVILLTFVIGTQMAHTQQFHLPSPLLQAVLVKSMPVSDRLLSAPAPTISAQSQLTLNFDSHYSPPRLQLPFARPRHSIRDFEFAAR